MRTDLYRLVHKAQRHHLFSFAQRLGRTDLDSPEEREQTAAAVREIVAMLRDHAANEERYIHPLFDGAHAFDDEHRDLDAQLDELTRILAEGRWAVLYSSMMRFIGVYLLHIDAEERAQAEQLWARYDDAVLAGVMARFKAERHPADAKKDLALMLPALSPSEAAAFQRVAVGG